MLDGIAQQPGWVETLGRRFQTTPPPLECDAAFWRTERARQFGQLAFWKEPAEGPWKQADGPVAAEAYERLVAGEDLDGIEALPIAQILERVREAFQQDFVQLDHSLWKGDGKGFKVQSMPRLFRVQCAGMSGEERNRFIDIGLEFGCPLYDVATRARFV